MAGSLAVAPGAYGCPARLTREGTPARAAI
nr:MAG TPA: hypothetical protein [Bacteriophage sp.]